MANEITTDNINTKAQEVASVGDGDYVYVFKTGAQGFSRVEVGAFAQGAGSSQSGGVSVSYNSSSKKTVITIGGGSTPQSGTAMPTISVTDILGGKSVTMSAQSGATIYYTTDGSTPTTSSTVYSSAIQLTVAKSTTIKAVAKASGKTISDIVQETVIVTKTTAPTCTMDASGSSAVITAARSGATVYISFDGETWVSGEGSASLTVQKTAQAQNISVRAYAESNGHTVSDTAQQMFVVPAAGQVASNIFSGTASAPVTAITINGTTYTDITNTQTEDGYDWSIDFGDTEFGTITFDGSSVKSIFTDGTTENRASITSITHMPNSWTELGAYALFCANCKSAVIGSGVTSILADAFYSTGITDIVIPDTVNTVNANAFRSSRARTIYVGSKSLSGVVFIPSSDTNAANLTSITFGSGVTTIGNTPLGGRNFSNLTSATFLGTNPQNMSITSPANLFGTSQNEDFMIHVPSGTVSAYQTLLGGQNGPWYNKITDQ